MTHLEIVFGWAVDLFIVILVNYYAKTNLNFWTKISEKIHKLVKFYLKLYSRPFQ